MSGASANSCVIRSPRLCGFHQRDEGDQRSNLSPCLLSASDPEFAYARGFYVWSPDSGVLPLFLDAHSQAAGKAREGTGTGLGLLPAAQHQDQGQLDKRQLALTQSRCVGQFDAIVFKELFHHATHSCYTRHQLTPSRSCRRFLPTAIFSQESFVVTWLLTSTILTLTPMGKPWLDPLEVIDWEARFLELLAEGDRLHPPAVAPPGQRGRCKQSAARNLLDRLRKHQQAVLAFLEDLRVDFDNNLPERDLRMVKVQQKVSGSFRSIPGAQAFI